MKKEKLKIALIGVGRWGKNHLRILKKLEKNNLCKVQFICDVDEKALQTAPVDDSVKKFTDYRELLHNDEVTAVDVVTPIRMHYDISKDFLKAEKDVFVEKPLAMSLDQAEDLVKLAKKSNRILMIGHIFRYNPATWKIKEEILRNNLGKIHFMHGHFMGIKPRKNDCGITISDAVHHIDLFNFLMERNPIQVTGIVRYCSKTSFEDTAILVLDYGDSIAYVEVSCITPIKLRDLTVIGSKKSLFADLLHQKIEIYEMMSKKRGESQGEAVITKPTIKYKEPLNLELSEFIKCIRDRTKPLADGEVGLNAVRIAEAALRSARIGRAVKL